jgi:hypothetical protein
MRVVIRAAAIVAAVAVFGFVACVPGVQASPASPPVRAIPSISVFPTATLTLMPSFSLDQTTADFGEVLVGTTKTVYVILRNADADAYGPQYVGGAPTSTDFKISFSDCYDQHFPAGWTCRVTYTFTPARAGAVTASSAFTITYVGVGPVLPRFTITLTGCGVTPGAGCPAPATSSATPSATRSATPTATRRPGSGTEPAAAPTGSAVAVDGAPGSAVPVSTGAALKAAANPTSGPTLLILVLAGAAVIGCAIVALLIWRGPRIWAMFTSRRP